MLIIVASDIRPQIGTKFLKYYLMGEAYNKGKIIRFDDEVVEVDFGDTVYEFQRAVCSTVFDAANNEHLMTCEEGRLLRDTRPRHPAAMNTSDLLDFSWMDTPG